MNYYSLNRKSPAVNFREATIKGQAPDKGLYFPEIIPAVEKELIRHIDQFSNEEIAFQVIRPYVGNCIAEDRLYEIVRETVNFPIPLVKLSESVFSLELFHGPTLAFKDVGARFMSRCLGAFVNEGPAKVTVLVATSGDTGGAVANGFYEVPGVEVVILYPSGKVSSVQEKQLTTLGKNIHALEIDGSFDDCQAMVKKAFADQDLNKKFFLTSANSINVARWLPQQFYYFFAYKQWQEKDHPPVMAVPSGNFGNICAGLLAHFSGLPVERFLAACNTNDTIPRFLQTGNWEPHPTKATLSNAMDVAHPSNFVRILELFHQEMGSLHHLLSGETVTDEQTVETLQQLYRNFGYQADPHGAVAYRVLENYLTSHPDHKGIFLETAHPVKFPEAIRMARLSEPSPPGSINDLLSVVYTTRWGRL
jgi:threonine synthase